MMTIKPFSTDNIEPFLRLAEAENWLAESWEFEFLLSQFPQGCFAAYGNNGETAGFVTSLRHDRSGWIGNLIVAAEYRGKGIGGRLFSSALEALRTAGVETFWLTASKSGKSLYEKYGFSSIDTMIRWVGAGRQRHATPAHLDHTKAVTASVCGIDRLAWGDRRDALLAASVGRGRLLLDESGFAVIQSCGDAWQFGPFSATGIGIAESIFETALRTVPNGTKIYLDAPASNREALVLFNRKRMRIAGINELMFAGVKPEYRPEYVYGLATMGSCG